MGKANEQGTTDGDGPVMEGEGLDGIHPVMRGKPVTAEAVTLMHSYLTACADSTDAQARQSAAWEAMTREQRVDATNRRMKMGMFGKRQ